MNLIKGNQLKKRFTQSDTLRFNVEGDFFRYLRLI